MEPEIIRMYSSSPPPLDSVADDDEEDEFGEFGGFSGVSNSGIGFSDFGAVSYSREGFKQSKHFMPINEYSDGVNNFTSLNSINDNENFSEHTSSKKGPSNVLETHTSNETVQFNVAALENKGSLTEKVKKTDKCINSESGFMYLDSNDLSSENQEESIGTCNGEKSHCLENLTNGFSVLDSVNPQGIEDLDSISDLKGFKTVNAHNKDLNIDFSPSASDGFADFATYSKTGSILLKDTEPKVHNGLYEGPAESIMTNSTLNRVDQGSSFREQVPTDLVSEKSNESIEHVVRNCTAETHTIVDHVEPLKNVSFTPQNEISASVIVQSQDFNKHSEKLTDHTHTNERNGEEMLEAVDEICWSTGAETLEGTKILESDVENYASDDLPPVTETVSKSVPPIDASNDTFGDFDAANEDSPPTFTEQFEPTNFVKRRLDLDVNVNEINDEFGEFKDPSTASIKEELKPTSDDRLTIQGSCNTYFDVENHDEFGSFSKEESSNTFQDTDDFADFSSAGNPNLASDWKAFDDDQAEPKWASFGDEKSDSAPPEADGWQSHRTEMLPSTEEMTINSENVPLSTFHENGSTFVSEGLTSASQQSLLTRLEQIIQVCFPLTHAVEEEEETLTLDHILKIKTSKESSKSLPTEVLDIWAEMQDIHDAYGLKYQWGGSHSNKKLLCCLGIDTRNILFTGNKKQPVIVPMYAASLGMLEPTKEPLKPLSAAEKIASLGQSSPVPSDDSICTPDQLQESLPPVQFDWSSSGLTNPLDASGGSTLLNLDFFGPVDDNGSNSNTTIPGVDPELYELTTAKLECSSANRKVTDAFARLMSTAETTSTSARIPRRDENLSDEAAKVIASIPDLSFMHAKVLMFPTTLTPSTSCQEKVD